MQPWTHEDRTSFIKRAMEEKAELRGSKGNYWFNVMPKNTGCVEIEDVKKSKVAEILAKTIFEDGEGRFRKISLKIYDILQQKIAGHPNLMPRDLANIAVVIKGSNAYKMLLSLYMHIPEIRDAFSFSDLDIVILINPSLPEHDFDRIKAVLHTIVVQTLSQYKRTLDHMLFLNKPFPDVFMSLEDIDEFKAVFTKNLTEADPNFLSPFTSDVVRNACSRNSFIIAESIGHADSVVRVEVPHFERCECIPLRKTPLFCSYNETLEFNRAVQKDIVALKAKFNLYRMKMNVLSVSEDKDTGKLREEKVTADFIDISIASRNDSELVDFWANGRCVTVFDTAINNWIWVPNIHTCIADLFKMLYVYECPEYKKEKRERKLDIMKKIVDGYYGHIQG